MTAEEFFEVSTEGDRMQLIDGVMVVDEPLLEHGHEAAGLPELWLVDTDARSVLVFRRSGPEASRFDVELELTEGGELSSALLPGFSLPAERLFRRG